MENEIWRNFKNGDQATLGILYEQYSPMLYAYGMKIAGDCELVNDQIQDLFMYLYDKRKNLSEPLSVKAYLLTSLKRRIRKQMNDESKLRTQTVRIEDDQYGRFNLIIDTQETLTHTDIREEQLEVLQKAINELSPRQREVLYLRYYKGLSVGEVSEVIGLEKQQIMNVCSIALSRLRQNESLTKTFLLAFYFLLHHMH